MLIWDTKQNTEQGKL